MDVGTAQFILSLLGLGVVALLLYVLFGTASDFAVKSFDKVQKRAYNNRKKWDREF